MNNVPRFRECAIFRTRVIRQKVSLKIIVFSMETPCWSPFEGIQHGGRKPVKHLEFSLPLSKPSFSLLNSNTFAQAHLSTYWLLITRKHRANRHFCTSNILPRNDADVTHCEKIVAYFQNKEVYRAEDRLTEILLNTAFT